MLILGLDGATWDVAGPAIAAGRLPNLARLRERSHWGVLRSTIPPVTFPAWTTFSTGVNPGRHGIFDFTRREPGSYGVRFVNATFRKAPTVWRRLSDAGRRVCVLGIPGTYPPEPINGCMISGFDTPVTTRADRSFVHPPEWADAVMAAGGFPFADFQEFRIGPGWHQQALARLLEGIEVKTRLALSLLRRERWDCFMLLFGESDTAAHHFWHLHDERSPRFDRALHADVGDALMCVYEALDVAVGRLLDAAGDSHVLVASDHGFGGVGTKTVFLNQWLAATGWQRRQPAAAGAWAARLKQAALAHVPPSFQSRLFRVADGRWASQLESRARFAGIDWVGTRVYSEDLNYFPSLWINLSGREPLGQVAASDYERVRDDLIAALSTWSDPQTGAPIVRRAWRREELYEGPYVGFAPDVVLDLATDGGYAYMCMPSQGAAPGEVVRDAPGGAGGKLAGMSGSHRPEGVFALVAPGLAAGGPGEADIADMGATILAELGVDVPAEFDGTPLGRRPQERVAAGGSPVTPESAYSDAEEREIEARLGALGYL